jgi:hypothetical protein
MFVQQVTDKSYSFVEPRLVWVRSKSILVDGVCSKIGSIVPSALSTADKYIDSTVEVVSSRASALQESVATKVVPVQSKLVDIQGFIVAKSLSMVGSSESMIDQLIPLAEESGEKQPSEPQAIVTRIAQLPFRMPVRVTCLVYVKVNGAVESMVLTSKHGAGIAAEKQAQFAQHMMARAKPLTDRMQSVAEAGAGHVRARRASATKAIGDSREYIYVHVNNMLVRLHVVEAKDWAFCEGQHARSRIAPFILAVVQMGHSMGSRVIGQERTSFVFSKLRLPQHSDDEPNAPVPQVAESEVTTIAG